MIKMRKHCLVLLLFVLGASEAMCYRRVPLARSPRTAAWVYVRSGPDDWFHGTPVLQPLGLLLLMILAFVYAGCVVGAARWLGQVRGIGRLLYTMTAGFVVTAIFVVISDPITLLAAFPRALSRMPPVLASHLPRGVTAMQAAVLSAGHALLVALMLLPAVLKTRAHER